MKTRKGFYWHVHHDKLIEWCYDYQERVDYIKSEKPTNEIETRLRLFKPVKNIKGLPKEYVEAWKKYDEAWKKYVEARKKCDEARKKCDEAWKKCDFELEALHKKECGCKEWNGKEIVFK